MYTGRSCLFELVHDCVAKINNITVDSLKTKHLHYCMNTYMFPQVRTCSFPFIFFLGVKATDL